MDNHLPAALDKSQILGCQVGQTDGEANEGPLDGFILGDAEAFGFAFLTRSEALLLSGEGIFDLEDALSLKQPVPMFDCCLPVWRGARISVSER